MLSAFLAAGACAVGLGSSLFPTAADSAEVERRVPPSISSGQQPVVGVQLFNFDRDRPVSLRKALNG